MTKQRGLTLPALNLTGPSPSLLLLDKIINIDPSASSTMKFLIPGFLIVSLLGMAPSATAENPEHRQQLLQTKSCPNCDLQAADLTALDLRRANLQGANLQNANLNLTDLTGANLSGAVLVGASLVWTDFTDTILDRANFSQSILSGGDLWGRAARFNQTTLMDGNAAYP